MINSVVVTNQVGESVTMDLRSPEKSGFFIRGIEGLGPPKSTINMTEVLSSDGAFYNSSRVASRNIVFNLGFHNDTAESIEQLRLKTYKYFPMKKEITIEVHTDSRIGVATGYVESNEPDIFSKEEGSIISILCPRAFFYGKDIIQEYFSGSSPKFEFPFENPSTSLKLIEMGTVFISTAKSILYTGDEDTGVTIYVTFTGNVSGLTITNSATSEVMSIDSTKLITLTGADFHVGDQLIISTLRGNKYIHLIRSGITYNILNTINTTSAWFRIIRGDNVFVYTAASGLANMQFLVEYKNVYGGL